MHLLMALLGMFNRVIAEFHKTNLCRSLGKKQITPFIETEDIHYAIMLETKIYIFYKSINLLSIHLSQTHVI